MFWKNRAGIETLASILMTTCIKAGLMGSASRLLEYLENERQTLGILPCERADLIAVSNAFNQGEKVETVIDINERVGELVAWEHILQKMKGMKTIMGSTANFYGKAADLLDHLKNPTEKNIRKTTTKIGISPHSITQAKKKKERWKRDYGSWKA